MVVRGYFRRSASFARRRPVCCSAIAVGVIALLSLLTGYVVLCEEMYALEPGSSDTIHPLHLALTPYVVEHRGEEADADAVREWLSRDERAVELLEYIMSDESSPLRFETARIEDEFGPGLLFYFPEHWVGSPWRRDYSLGIMLYDGLEWGRSVRLYRLPMEEGFSAEDIDQGRFGGGTLFVDSGAAPVSRANDDEPEGS
ncbi:MAG: hypothetical protein ACYTAN_14590 [Planctomycetota bacterium]|jgi:hypothetical protein